MTHAPLSAVLSMVLVLPLIAGQGRPADQCEPLTPMKGELGYQWRADRCEGLFVRDIASSVRLLAFMSTAANAPTLPGRLAIAFPSVPPGGRYRVRVHSLDPQVNYQLDARTLASPYEWPNTILSKVPLSASQLAVLVWRTADHDVLVPASLAGPLQVKLGKPAVAIAIVESMVPIESFAARLNAQGGTDRVELATESALPVRQLQIGIPSKLKSGIYELWLRVKLLGESKPETLTWDIWLP